MAIKTNSPIPPPIKATFSTPGIMELLVRVFLLFPAIELSLSETFVDAVGRSDDEVVGELLPLVY